MKTNIMRKLPLAGLISLLTSTTTFAQEAEFSGLEEIIVTAQKREQALQDVPISISVATEEQLKRDQIYTLSDLQRAAPGLEIAPTFGGEQNGGARIRGIGTNLFSEGAAPSVAVVVDQMPSGNIAMPEIFDLAQVEVLRGPQGTLFGQSASAGVINITSKSPEFDEFSAEIGGDYQWNDYDQELINGAVNIPLTDNSAMRLATRYTHRKGAKINRYLDQENEDDIFSLRGSYLVEPSDTLSIKVIGEYHTKDTNDDFFNQAIAPTATIFGNSPEAQLAVLTGCGDADPIDISDRSAREYCSQIMPESELEWMSLGAIVDWDISDELGLTSVTSYRTKDHNEIYRNYSRSPDALVQAQETNNGYDGTQISQELRLSTNFDSAFNFITGLYVAEYETETFPTDGTLGDASDPAGFLICNLNNTFCIVGPTFTFSKIETSTVAAFIDGTLDISDSVSLFAGLRYTNHKSEYSIGANGPFTAFGDEEDNLFSGRIGANFDIGDLGKVYASLSRGVKPSFVDINANPNVPPIALEPEKNTSWELGWKSSVGKVSVDTALFHMSMKNYQAQTSISQDGQLTAVPLNIEEVESYGLEVSAYGQLTESVSFNAGYIFNSATYPDGFLGDGLGDLSGEQLATAPEHKLTFSGEWTTEVTSGIEAFVNMNAVYVSDMRLTARADDVYTYDAHARWGGSLGVRSQDDAWAVRLYGRNLGDENFPVAALASQFAGQENGGVRYWTAPGVSFRQIGLSFDVKF